MAAVLFCNYAKTRRILNVYRYYKMHVPSQSIDYQYLKKTKIDKQLEASTIKA